MESVYPGEVWKEVHSFGWCFGGLLLLVCAGGVAMVFLGIASDSWFTAVAALAVIALMAFLYWSFGTLRFVITDDEVAFGFPLYGKRVPRSAVERCEPYELKFSNYLGYGIRLGRDGTVAYNTRNGPGVALTIAGEKRRVVISVDDPARVCEILSPVSGTVR